MSLVAHLTELRNRIANALLSLLIGTAIAFWWYDHGLGEFIRAPYCGLADDLPRPATATTTAACWSPTSSAACSSG